MMPRMVVPSPLSVGAVLSGALLSAWLTVFVYLTWIREAPGVVAWALMPYAVLAAILLGGYVFRLDRSVRRFSELAATAIAAGGPLSCFSDIFIQGDYLERLTVLVASAI